MQNVRATGRPPQHNRHSIRLKGYDYSQPGAYFVTICTQGRECLFGDVVDGEMRLNDAGEMVQSVWDAIPSHYLDVDTDAFQIMPNHIHGIIVIVGAAPCGRPKTGPRACPDMAESRTGQATRQPPATGQPQGVAPTLSLPDVVHRFKTLTTKRYTDGVKQSGWPRFDGKLWQRNYYEHIIRNDESLNCIREYIANNPLQWELDRENPTVGAGPRACPENEPWHV